MGHIIIDKIKRQEVLDTRKSLIEDFRKLESEYKEILDNDAKRKKIFEEINIITKKRKENIKEYYTLLPHLTVSECPYTSKPLIRQFDPVDLDGYWWMESMRYIEEIWSDPETFRVLRWAVNLHDNTPKCIRDVLIWPEVPYVIPRILDLPTMIMVISQTVLNSGYTVYFLSYFSLEEPAPGQLTSNWLELNEYYFTDSDGKDWWKIPNDAWDFDISSWIKKWKIRWILPDEDTLAPVSYNPLDCPYVNIKGRDFPQVVKDNWVWPCPLPDPNI